MRPTHAVGMLIASAWIVAGCATLHPDYETPTVNVIAVRALPNEGLTPQFAIDLRIINPNRNSLALRGVAYTLTLEGYKILTGVANELPTIPGYDEGDVTLIASANLLGSIRFFTDLMNTRRDAVAFVLEAKLDPGGLRPAIVLSEKGSINLTGRTP